MHSETYEQIFHQEFDKLVHLATFIVGSRAVAEETVQEAFIKLHSDWFSVKNPGGFLHVTVINKCKGLIRKRKVTSKHLRLVEPDFQSEEPNDYLIDVLQKLKPLRRSVIVLKFYGGYTIHQIAELLDIPEGTARSNLERAKKDLREELENDG